MAKNNLTKIQLSPQEAEANGIFLEKDLLSGKVFAKQRGTGIIGSATLGEVQYQEK